MSTLIIVGLLLGAIIIAFALRRTAAPVGVGFLGFTNGVAGQRLASFGFTNQSGFTIRRWGIFDRQVNKSPMLACTFTLGPHVFLSPGQAEVILVPLEAKPAVPYQKNWRAVFYWRREGLGTRFAIWRSSSQSLPTGLKSYGVRVQAAPSEWIDP